MCEADSSEEGVIAVVKTSAWSHSNPCHYWGKMVNLCFPAHDDLLSEIVAVSVAVSIDNQLEECRWVPVPIRGVIELAAVSIFADHLSNCMRSSNTRRQTDKLMSCAFR